MATNEYDKRRTPTHMHARNKSHALWMHYQLCCSGPKAANATKMRRWRPKRSTENRKKESNQVSDFINFIGAKKKQPSDRAFEKKKKWKKKRRRRKLKRRIFIVLWAKLPVNSIWNKRNVHLRPLQHGSVRLSAFLCCCFPSTIVFFLFFFLLLDSIWRDFWMNVDGQQRKRNI